MAWLDRLLARHGDLEALSCSPGSEKNATCQLNWTYADLFRNVQAVGGAMCAASHENSSPSDDSAEPVNGARHSFGEAHIVVYGPALLQSVAAIACSQQDFAAVFVPTEDRQEHTLSNLLVIQRACDASIILIDFDVWRNLKADLANRWRLSSCCSALCFLEIFCLWRSLQSAMAHFSSTPLSVC